MSVGENLVSLGASRMNGRIVVVLLSILFLADATIRQRPTGSTFSQTSALVVLPGMPQIGSGTETAKYKTLERKEACLTT